MNYNLRLDGCRDAARHVPTVCVVHENKNPLQGGVFSCSVPQGIIILWCGGADAAEVSRCLRVTRCVAL
ncbi:MAG: hypothetical protein II852_09085, partial [Bacteroidales bacterium]|nr:hypothetical protein [Bacteroidales bacterium]